MTPRDELIEDIAMKYALASSDPLTAKAHIETILRDFAARSDAQGERRKGERRGTVELTRKERELVRCRRTGTDRRKPNAAPLNTPEEQDMEAARQDLAPDAGTPRAWMVERDTDYESREFFITEELANQNARLGAVDSHVVTLYDGATVNRLLSQRDAAVRERYEPMHASANTGNKCSDCAIDKEPCPVCYSAWWRKKHPNTNLVLADDSEVYAALKRAESAEARIRELEAQLTAEPAAPAATDAELLFCLRVMETLPMSDPRHRITIKQAADRIEALAKLLSERTEG